MIEKLEKALDLAADALSLYIRKTTNELGEALPLPGEQPAGKPRARRAAASKAEPAAAAAAAPAPVTGSVEEQLEAARRCKEVIGVFIRARLTAKPSGVEQATAIIKEQLGAPRKSYDVKGVMTPMWKLEDLTYAENLKLIPIFESQLDKVAA